MSESRVWMDRIKLRQRVLVRALYLLYTLLQLIFVVACNEIAHFPSGPEVKPQNDAEQQEEEIVSTYPPDGWAVSSGVWGTDFDQNSAQTYASAYSIEFKNTTPASDPILISDDFIPVDPNAAYKVYSAIRMSRNDPGDYFRTYMYCYDAAQAYLASTYADSATVPINTWAFIGTVAIPSIVSANTKYIKLGLTKRNLAFTTYVGLTRIEQLPDAFYSHAAAATALVAGNWTQVTFSEDLDIGSNFAASRFTAKRDGFFSFNASIMVDDLADGKQYGIALYQNGAVYRQVILTSGAAADQSVNISSVMYLWKNYYVEVYGYNGDAVDRNTVTGATQTFFEGFELTP